MEEKLARVKQYLVEAEARISCEDWDEIEKAARVGAAVEGPIIEVLGCLPHDITTVMNNLNQQFIQLKAEIERLQNATVLATENTKLRQLIELSTDIENESPGCGECAKRHDDALIAEKGEATDLNELKHGWWQYKQDKQNEIIEKYNALYTELGLL